MEKKSSSIFRIDERVFFTMALVGLTCILVLAFRYSNTEPCEGVTISVDAPAGFYVGSNIYFKAKAKSGNVYRWDFGDTSILAYPASSPMYAFKRPGWYTVTVRVTDQCDEIKNIHITEKPVDVIEEWQPVFYGPETAQVDEPLTFTDSTPGATSWEWSFEEIGRVDVRGRDASWTYETPGRKEVYLKINGRGDKVGMRTIMITDSQVLSEKNRKTSKKPRFNKRRRPGRSIRLKDAPTGEAILPPPVEDKPVEKKHPEITRDQVRSYLMAVVEGSQSAQGFSLQLCGNLELSVTYNDKQMTFTDMCKQLNKIKKRRRVKNLNFDIKQDNGCIKQMKVYLRKTLI